MNTLSTLNEQGDYYRIFVATRFNKSPEPSLWTILPSLDSFKFLEAQFSTSDLGAVVSYVVK